MIWLFTEMFVFIAAAVVFGGIIGLGLAGSGAKRRVVAFEREHKGLIDQLATYERSQRGVEAKAVARAAAEAAARGDLEGRLVEMETAAADYRARAEAAERRVRTMQSPPGDSPEIIEAVTPVTAETDGGAEAASLRSALEAAQEVRGKAEHDLRQIEAERDQALASAAAAERAAAEARALTAQELDSLRAQLALAERVRARTEIDLAVAQARALESQRLTVRAAEDALDLDGEKPEGLPAPNGGRADDLRRIRGIGPKNEGVLNALGIYHYEQIAALSPANIAWLDAYMKFHGRIARDDWVGQAKALLGSEGEAADKVHPQDVGA